MLPLTAVTLASMGDSTVRTQVVTDNATISENFGGLKNQGDCQASVIAFLDQRSLGDQ